MVDRLKKYKTEAEKKAAYKRRREKDNAQHRERYNKDKEFREKRLAQIRKYHKQNPEVNRKSRKKREKEKPEEIQAWRNEYRLKNKDKLKKRRSNYYKKNKDKENQYSKKYLKENKEKIAVWRRAYEKTPEVRAKINARFNKRIKTDVIFRIRRNLKGRIYEYIKIKKGRKQGTMKELLGCDWKFFKSYLEKKFQPGMTWKNYGKWHIDHIMPLSKFDLSLKSEQFKSCHHTNLQPLWAIDNIRKQNK